MKISKIVLKVFSVGVLLTLFAGALGFCGYMAALVIGGETATALCGFIYSTYFPWVIRICSISVGFGLVGMYMEKKQALSLDSDKKKDKK